MGKTLVATVWGHEPIMKSVAEYNISEIVLVYERPELAEKSDREKKEESIKVIENALDTVTEIKKVETELNEIYDIAYDVFNVLKDRGSVILNVTGGRKPQTIGCMMAASITDNVEEIVYWTPHEEVKQIPRFDISVQGKKRKVLSEVMDGKQPQEISDSIDLSQSMIYNHLKELRRKNFVRKDNQWNITELGEFVLEAQ